MVDHIKQSFSETRPDPAVLPVAKLDPAPVAGQAAAAVEETDPTVPGDLWPEAADARCSESAALFAGTQPAPLSVV